MASELHTVSAQLERGSHPELEDYGNIAWGLTQCDVANGGGDDVVVDVLRVRGQEVIWRWDVWDEELSKIVEEVGTQGERELKVFFINTLRSKAGYLPGNFSFRTTTLRLLQRAGLSSVILDSIFTHHGRWANMGNQCFTKRYQNGNLEKFEICYRYCNGWNHGRSFIQLIRTQHQTTYFCINYASQARDRLKTCLDKYSQFAYRDFFVDALAMDVSLRKWTEDIGERRIKLLEHEQMYHDDSIDFNQATYELHQLSYTWNTLNQDCSDHLAQIEFLQHSYEKYINRLKEKPNVWDVDVMNDMGETIETLKSQCQNLVRWTDVYRDRTNIRINLLFHLASQRESRTNTQIASSTAAVAEQTQRDSASMITIAAVTMFFLPGTFISAILSTTFFDYGDNGLTVSQKWWILPASFIPTTILVFGVWLGWQRWRARMQRNKNGKVLVGS